jgi:hypothetical protein
MWPPGEGRPPRPAAASTGPVCACITGALTRPRAVRPGPAGPVERSAGHRSSARDAPMWRVPIPLRNSEVRACRRGSRSRGASRRVPLPGSQCGVGNGRTILGPPSTTSLGDPQASLDGHQEHRPVVARRWRREPRPRRPRDDRVRPLPTLLRPPGTPALLRHHLPAERLAAAPRSSRGAVGDRGQGQHCLRV